MRIAVAVLLLFAMVVGLVSIVESSPVEISHEITVDNNVDQVLDVELEAEAVDELAELVCGCRHCRLRLMRTSVNARESLAPSAIIEPIRYSARLRDAGSDRSITPRCASWYCGRNRRLDTAPIAGRFAGDRI